MTPQQISDTLKHFDAATEHDAYHVQVFLAGSDAVVVGAAWQPHDGVWRIDTGTGAGTGAPQATVIIDPAHVAAIKLIPI